MIVSGKISHHRGSTPPPFLSVCTLLGDYAGEKRENIILVHARSTDEELSEPLTRRECSQKKKKKKNIVFIMQKKTLLSLYVYAFTVLARVISDVFSWARTKICCIGNSSPRAPPTYEWMAEYASFSLAKREKSEFQYWNARIFFSFRFCTVHYFNSVKNAFAVTSGGKRQWRKCQS